MYSKEEMLYDLEKIIKNLVKARNEVGIHRATLSEYEEYNDMIRPLVDLFVDYKIDELRENIYKVE